MSEETMQDDTTTLSKLFDNAFELFNEISKTSQPTNSTKVQSDIKRAMHMLEEATKLVSVVDMFSDNENFEEIATENIKYLLLPALLGTLTAKLFSLDDRLHIVNVAEIYFIDFLKRLKSYGLTNVSLPEEQEKEQDSVKSRSNTEAITEMVFRRNTKLQRYKEQKELESQLETLKSNMDNPNIDDEVKREYFTTLIKLYVNSAIEELSMLGAEKPILEHMQNVSETNTHAPRRLKQPPAKLQPIIITRDEVQKKVFGAGYPSLPVLTVQEFYDQRVKDGDWPDPSKHAGKCLQEMANASGNNAEQDEIRQERLVEADDEENLMQIRAMDEYKDTHRRGWGNRANRS